MSELVEVVACTVDDAVAAEQAGAGRIELVSAISEGGLTPSIGALREVKANCRIPVACMIRPRGGGFVYTEGEFATMLRDASRFRSAGADALVVGMLTATGEVDVERLESLLGEGDGIQWGFHRAFDVVAEPFRALDALIDLGFSRLLTSGQAPTAALGVTRLRALREHADGRIEIMPGGGIRAANVREVLDATGATSVHLGPFLPRADPWSGEEHFALDAEEVRRLVKNV